MFLDNKFKISDLGVLQYFLEIEVIRFSEILCFSQRKYVLDLLTSYGLLGCKPFVVPIDQNLRLYDIVYDSDPLLKKCCGISIIGW